MKKLLTFCILLATLISHSTVLAEEDVVLVRIENWSVSGTSPNNTTDYRTTKAVNNSIDGDISLVYQCHKFISNGHNASFISFKDKTNFPSGGYSASINYESSYDKGAFTSYQIFSDMIKINNLHFFKVIKNSSDIVVSITISDKADSLFNNSNVIYKNKGIKFQVKGFDEVINAMELNCDLAR